MLLGVAAAAGVAAALDRGGREGIALLGVLRGGRPSPKPGLPNPAGPAAVCAAALVVACGVAAAGVCCCPSVEAAG